MKSQESALTHEGWCRPECMLPLANMATLTAIITPTQIAASHRSLMRSILSARGKAARLGQCSGTPDARR